VDAAGRLPNPGFRFSRLTRGSEVELERGWHIDLARLLTLPLVRTAEQHRRQIELIADEEGDWAFHCHKAHHTMNAMGHDVPTMLGVDASDLKAKIRKLVPGYMAMGQSGMHEMTEMSMPGPENTAPMMAGDDPFGAIAMGGMFSTLKVRRGLKRGDYSDPDWFQHPTGTLAREVGDAPPAPAAPGAAASRPANVEVQIRKPQGHHGH